MYKKINWFVFLVVVLFFNAQGIFAANPGAPISPSDNIQDPGALTTPWGGCGPTDSNCYVTISGGPTIYTGDGSLTGNRIVDLNSNNLSISDNGNDFLSIFPSSFRSVLTGGDGTGFSQLVLDGDSADPSVAFQLISNDGANQVSMVGNAVDQNIIFHAVNGVSIGDDTPVSLFNVGTTSQFQVNSSGAIAAATGLTSSGAITFSGISGSTQCLHVNSSGVVTGTGSDCGSGGGSATWNGITNPVGNQTLSFGTNTSSWTSSATTQTFLGLAANSLTTGQIINIGHTTSVIADGGSLIRATSSSVDTGGATNGTLLDLSASGAVTGTLARITASAASQTTDTALNITQSGATLTGYTGDFVSLTGGFSGGGSTGNVLRINTVNTTGGSGLLINANALTGGTAFNIQHTTSVINNGSLIRLSSTSADTGTVTGTLLDLLSTTSTAGTQFLETYSGLSTGIGQKIVTNSLTSGNALAVASSSTAFTGNLASFTLSGSNAANTGSVVDIENTGTANTNTALLINHYATGANNLAFRVNDVSGDTTPFVIDGSGNVGIGNSTPAELLAIGSNSGSLGTLSLSGNTSGKIIIQPQAAAGTYNFNLPITAGTSGYLLTSGGGAGTAMTWTNPASLVPAVTATQIAYGDSITGLLTSSDLFTIQDGLYPGIILGSAGHNGFGISMRTATGEFSTLGSFTGLDIRSGTQTYPVTIGVKAALVATFQNNTGTDSGESNAGIAAFNAQISSAYIGTGGLDKGAFHLERTIDSGSSGNNHHGFVDKTTFSTGLASANSFYSEMTIGNNYDLAHAQGHGSGFQTRFDKIGSSTLTNIYDFNANGDLIDSGNVTNRYGYYLFDANASGGGVLTNQYGIYISPMSAATNNYGAYFGNSVGIGDSTPDYLLDVENTGVDGNIFALHDSDGECLHNPEAGSEVVSCSSDARLKTNIVDAAQVLVYFNDFKIRDYTVIASGDQMTGVIAQEVLQNHPELVTQNSEGMYSVQLPNQWKVIKAIQELDLKIESINSLTEGDNSFVDNLRSWFANASNHITRIFTGEICLTDSDGSSECLNKSQLQQIKQLINNQNTSGDAVETPPTDPPASDPAPTPPSSDNPPTP